ncbi:MULTISPECIES: ABC transporter permease [Bacillus]|uniref:ABC transporter permease n=1 Tax=Bacillus glycinifermentans TaxID=1664069 RepID=A0AAJ3Z2D0_9BACI|nr:MULTISPECIES: ABC transporter permease [Bacillus]KKB74061.1 ABC transporter permease [Bacillus sp. TH008]MDU0070178.1 ABC transporter permease [Bacillus sp. IG6]MED8017888.1 ABC transporter permease [Bacillus glycinifermentans]QAT67667.1 ABC transporter permease [Bacillus glycinifermentans]WKB77329.1 ABC transporter permease [Bacillus glycinifermentans]
MNVFQMQCKMEIKRMLRNRYFVFWSLVMPIAFYYIFTNVVNTNAPDPGAWKAHYLMSMTTFSVMGSSIMSLGIRMVQERTQGWSTFIRMTPLSDHVYFIAQMAGQSVIHILSITVIFSFGAIINGVSLTPFEWFMSGLWILLGSLPFLAIGTLIGMMKKVDTAAGVSNVLYMVLAVTGGMWMPLEVMPKMMQSFSHWLPSYHFGNGAWEIVRGKMPDWNNVLILFAYFIVLMLLSKYMRRKQEAV